MQLPPATHVFIGGSAGNMDAIVEAALAKLPENKEAASEKNSSNLAGCGNHKPIQIRFVINCIALGSTAQALACAKKYGREEPEVTQISVARGHAVGNYTMMKSENPITIICFDAENPINSVNEKKKTKETIKITQMEACLCKCQEFYCAPVQAAAVRPC